MGIFISKSHTHIYTLTRISSENWASISFHTGKSEKETYHIPHPPILMEAATTAQIQKQKQKVTISLYED